MRDTCECRLAISWALCFCMLSMLCHGQQTACGKKCHARHTCPIFHMGVSSFLDSPAAAASSFAPAGRGGRDATVSANPCGDAPIGKASLTLGGFGCHGALQQIVSAVLVPTGRRRLQGVQRNKLMLRAASTPPLNTCGILSTRLAAASGPASAA